MSLAARQQLVVSGPLGRKNSLAKASQPFQNMKKDELMRELNARRIYKGGNKETTGEAFRRGAPWRPKSTSFALYQPNIHNGTINCGKYEVLSFEPVHDIGKHIENILTELPFHLPKKEAAAVNDVIQSSLGGKDTKCTFDYRCALIILAKQSFKIISSELVQHLLATLVEIQRIA